jgi:glycosyltransferase involved in cell wall biosynthesis
MSSWYRNGTTLQQETRARRRQRIAFVITEDWYFVLHWLSIARVAREVGFDVVVITRVRACRERIVDEGFEIVDWQSQRASLNPLKVSVAVGALTRILRRQQPDIVHNISLQCAVMGSLAALRAGIRCVINSINGFGYLATGGLHNRLILSIVLRFIDRFSRTKRLTTFTIVPNRQDYAVLRAASRNVILIPGLGIDLAKFTPQPVDEQEVGVGLVGRIVKEKGIHTFMRAAQLVKSVHPSTRFILAGALDEAPGAIPKNVVEEWMRGGILEWWGFVDDVRKVWRQAQIAVLPSFREGLPTALLEAASCGRALIATDVPGCSDVVRDNVNGFLIPVDDSIALAAAIKTLIEDRELRVKFGQAAQFLVQSTFSKQVIHEEYRRLYRNTC